MLDHLLTTPQAIPFIQGNHFVHRPEVDALVAELVLADGGVVVVEGPEGAGKSTAVAAAVANVSATIPTFSTKAWLRDTVDTLLRRMIGMPACGALFWFFWGETPVAELLWFRKRSPVQPIFVIDAVEELPPAVLTMLITLSRRLASDRLGRFVFVVSPPPNSNVTRALQELPSSARFITVGVLGHRATLRVLASQDCFGQAAETAAKATGGYLPAVHTDAVCGFCAGDIDQRVMEEALLQPVVAATTMVDGKLGCQWPNCSCRGLLAVQAGNGSSSAETQALLSSGIVRHALAKRRTVVELPQVAHFIASYCPTAKTEHVKTTNTSDRPAGYGVHIGPGSGVFYFAT